MRRRRPVKNLPTPKQVVLRQRPVLSAHDLPVLKQRPVSVVPEYELPEEHEGLHRLILRDQVSRTLEEHVGHVALLMYDARDRAVVVVPRRCGAPRETLDAPEREVLDDDLRTAVRVLRVVVARVEHPRNTLRGRVREELGEEDCGLD